MTASEHDSPGVAFPPPLLFVAGFVAGLLVDGVVPIGLLGAAGRRTAVIAGWTMVVAGLALMAAGLVTFVGARTAVMPHLPARRLVTSGPYRFTRNPMYLGLTIAYAGIALLIDTAWPLIVLPLVLALLVRVVIRREERYLEHAFGGEYREYCRRVGRWI
ncbi:MAG: isoprenylcysteine carboxylmethyltransferase family protein [Gemmatimonadota bacterium]|nr:isoprenylcysteine carboxylmethyltransferase family protein [Gemmatimonadota bacterium]